MKNKKISDKDNIIIENSWKLLEYTVGAVEKKKENKISLDEEKKELFTEYYNDHMETIKESYMDKNVGTLDRHKTAAILMASIIESKAIIVGEKLRDKYFFGEYVIALSVGINYMIDRLNARLKKRTEEKSIKEIWMPKIIFSCSVPFFEIMARHLYFAEEESQEKIPNSTLLILSQTLFLLEYITLEKAKIDPAILKVDNKSNENNEG